MNADVLPASGSRYPWISVSPTPAAWKVTLPVMDCYDTLAKEVVWGVVKTTSYPNFLCRTKICTHL